VTDCEVKRAGRLLSKMCAQAISPSLMLTSHVVEKSVRLFARWGFVPVCRNHQVQLTSLTPLRVWLPHFLLTQSLRLLPLLLLLHLPLFLL